MRALLVASLGFTVVACRDVPQAPNPTLPTPPSFQAFYFDHEGREDAGVAFAPGTILPIAPSGPVVIVYPNSYDGVLRYAMCMADCADPARWHKTTVDSAESGYNYVADEALGTVSAGGALHALYNLTGVQPSRTALIYAACVGACDNPGNWRRTILDTTSSTGWLISLVADTTGRLHAIYGTSRYFFDARPAADTSVQLIYLTCATACDTAASWQRGHIGVHGAVAGTALRVDALGRLHLAYWLGSETHYATCANQCVDSTQWSQATVSPALPVREVPWIVPAFDVDAAGRAVFAQWAGNTLELASCVAACAASPSWQTTPVLTLPDSAAPGTSLAIALGSAGGLHIAFGWGAIGNGALTYARCDSACTSPAGWGAAVVDSGFLIGREYVAMSLDALQRPRFFYDGGFGAKYAEPKNSITLTPFPR